MVNYITAAATGIFTSNVKFDMLSITNAAWFKIAFPLGLLFILIFYFISQTAQKISVATASVANKMSVAMPVLFSVFALQQSIGVFKWIGIVLAIVSVYLTTRPSGSSKTQSLPKAYLWLPLIVFIGSGLIDICINAANALYIKNPSESELFSITTFLSAFSFGLVLTLIGFIVPKLALAAPLQSTKEIAKSLIGGILLGIPNYFSIVFIFKALETSVLSSAELFPVLNVSNVVLASVLGILVYKEKLSVVNALGIGLAVLAIVCIAL